MDKRYRLLLYFIGILILGSLLLDWLTGSIRVPDPSRVQDANAIQPSPAAPPPTQPDPSAEGYTPPYAPSYENPSIADQETTVRQDPPAERPSLTGMANSSDLQAPAPPPTIPTETEEAPERDQYTTSPKSSNAELREKLKPKGR